MSSYNLVFHSGVSSLALSNKIREASFAGTVVAIGFETQRDLRSFVGEWDIRPHSLLLGGEDIYQYPHQDILSLEEAREFVELAVYGDFVNSVIILQRGEIENE